MVETLESESYVLAGMDLGMSILCWFYFYNDPKLIDIEINEEKEIKRNLIL